MHACMHAYIHTYIHTYVHTYIHTYTHTYYITYESILTEVSDSGLPPPSLESAASGSAAPSEASGPAGLRKPWVSGLEKIIISHVYGI